MSRHEEGGRDNQWKAPTPGVIQPDRTGVRKVVTWVVLAFFCWLAIGLMVFISRLAWELLW